MNKQWCLMSLIIVGLWSVGNRTFAETTPEEAEGTDERKWTVEELTVIHERGVKLLQKTAHGRFVLAGEVVDREGRLLDDVKLHMTMDTLVGWGWEVKSKGRQDIIKNGAFRIDVRPYNGITMRFEKDGYYPEDRDFNFSAEYPAGVEQAVLRGEDVKVDEGVVRDENIRVVMEKKGVVMEPVVYGGPLLYAPGYGGTTAKIVYIDFSIPPQKDYKLKSVPSLAEVTNIPTYTAYAIADVDEERRVAHEMIKIGTFRPEAYAKNIYLRINDPEGGFIEYVPKPKELAFWTMKTAPESGYVQEIVIDPEMVMNQIVNVQGNYSGIHFYFKVGGRYGKGSIGQIDVKNGGESVRIFIAFMVQPDGSRNVDTGRQIL